MKNRQKDPQNGIESPELAASQIPEVTTDFYITDAETNR